MGEQVRDRVRLRIPHGDVLEAVRRNTRGVDRIVARAEGPALLRVLRETEADLRRRLRDAYARGLRDRWTGLHAVSVHVMVVASIRRTSARMLELLARTGRYLVERGMLDSLAILALQELRHTGVLSPLRLEQAMRFEHVLHGVASSRLRQYETSVARYGTRMIGEIERALQVGVVGQQSVGQMIDAVAGTIARPGVFETRRYWAERIVRTELMASYNLGAQGAIEEEVEEFPDLKRIILAHHDRRTAEDSIFVHGAIRGVREMFVDGAGRRYLVPPGRPNDREVVVPWREGWRKPRQFSRGGVAGA